MSHHFTTCACLSSPVVEEEDAGPSTAVQGGAEAHWGSFEEDAHSQTAEKLLQALKNVDHGMKTLSTIVIYCTSAIDLFRLYIGVTLLVCRLVGCGCVCI